MSLSFVLGGVRSGKSRYAEAIHGYRYDVTYLAAGSRPADPVADPEWAARVAFHQASRQKTWRTIETTDLVGQLSAPGGPLLIDCLGTWPYPYTHLDVYQSQACTIRTASTPPVPSPSRKSRSSRGSSAGVRNSVV